MVFGNAFTVALLHLKQTCVEQNIALAFADWGIKPV